MVGVHDMQTIAAADVVEPDVDEDAVSRGRTAGVGDGEDRRCNGCGEATRIRRQTTGDGCPASTHSKSVVGTDGGGPGDGARCGDASIVVGDATGRSQLIG